MKFRISAWFLLLAVMVSGVYLAETLMQQKQLAEKTIRLHVVANSDTEEDQAQKLRVRDAVLETVQSLTEQCTDAQSAWQELQAHLPQIAGSAKAVLLAEQSDRTVEVSLTTEKFDTRHYDTFTLPAGEYPALRIKIGEAQGKNWWCVVFPALCTAASTDTLEQCAEVGGYDAAETQWITGGEEEYHLRFKVLEWFQKLSDWLA